MVQTRTRSAKLHVVSFSLDSSCPWKQKNHSMSHSIESTCIVCFHSAPVFLFSFASLPRQFCRDCLSLFVLSPPPSRVCLFAPLPSRTRPSLVLRLTSARQPVRQLVCVCLSASLPLCLSVSLPLFITPCVFRCHTLVYRVVTVSPRPALV